MKFAAYAKQVAKKFPWLVYYTPVNEPLTTARFCGLYGLWYPHQKNELSFFKMLLNQLKGTVLAMQAIQDEDGAKALGHAGADRLRVQRHRPQRLSRPRP